MGDTSPRNTSTKGSFGEVWRAYDHQLARDVALKLAAVNTADAKSSTAFEREARAAATLQHRNIVTVFGAGLQELHQYKNLATSSAISDANIEGSKRASDLHAKIDYLRHSKGERVVTGATATPIANSITEMYVMQRYLDPETLTRAGIHDFDSWAATFGEVVTVTELAVAGANTFKVKNRFAKFTNVPELLAMFTPSATSRPPPTWTCPARNWSPGPTGSGHRN